jgi:hypothetical protein
MRFLFLLTAIAGALTTFTAGVASAAPPSGIYTGDAQQVTDTTARLLGYAVGPVPATACWFEYGPTTGYGSRTDVPCGGTTDAHLTQLQPGTPYHYRFGGSNADGATYGVDKTFTTTGTAPPPPPPGGTPLPAVDVTARALGAPSPSVVARRGLRIRVRVAGSCPCTVRERLTVSRRVARRLGLRTRVLADRTESLPAGTETITLKPRRKARRALRRARRVTATLSMQLTDAAGRSDAASRTVRLRRSGRP